MPVGYNQDVVAWATEQARLIRAGHFDQLDIEHIADEVEDADRSEKRDLANRIAVLLADLLKWQFQPTHRGTIWTRTMQEQHKQVLRKLKVTPSLSALLNDPERGEGAWGDAVTLAISETGLDAFPEAYSWNLADVLADDWLPR